MAGNAYLTLVSGIRTLIASVQASAGAGDAGKIVALDAAGKLDATMMPTGVAADVVTATATEALSAGNLVNIYNSSGAKVRKADATAVGKPAHGFVKAAFANAAVVTIYCEGSNDQVTGLTPGDQYLSTTPGAATATPPSGSGNVVQNVGFASSATNLNFQANTVDVLN